MAISGIVRIFIPDILVIADYSVIADISVFVKLYNYHLCL